MNESMGPVDAMRVLVSRYLEHNGKKKADLARAMGLTPQTLDIRLRKSNNPKIGNFVELMDAIDMEVVVVKKGVRLPEGSVAIREVVE